MTCSHCCGSGIEPSVLTLDVAHPCGLCGGKGVYPPEWWRDVSHTVCDCEKHAQRVFAMSLIHGWRDASATERSEK